MIEQLLNLIASGPLDNVENVITDPYGTLTGAWGDFAPIMILAIFMTAITLVYIKTQSVAPTLVAFIIGSLTLGVIFPAHDIVQKLMFILAAVGIAAMLYYAFAKRFGE